MKRPPVFKPGAFKPGVFRKRHPRRVHPRLKGLSINHLLPNVLTVLALCAGLTAIRFAIDGQWRPAVVSVVTAAILDALDGRIARLLNGQSKFGAELDSLSDVVSFGVAPAIMMYLWALGSAGSFGWIAALAYAVCMALRLARFNSRLGAPDLPPWAFNYFTGVPAPAGAGLVLLPMVAGFEVDPALVSHPVLVVPWTLAMALLLVSTLPTFSGKGMRVPTDYVVPALVGVGLLAAFLVAQPWWTLILLGIAYVALIPVSLRQFRKLQRAAADIQAPAEGEAPAAEAPVDEEKKGGVA
ncbi:phosphatidylcholine/phosphatidylserine synthase [Azospirillum sp. TSO22-1]|uniref:CDP-alcohol phosphatidyltransferase family protein n=1 Tax=Azospirillum sp. TSO22-1 TaxID=716789 RepID=UPI000D61B8DC|nr:phosphatidylcholine/phosphatidylserine synthase [Azospirillum sp. TSO22-1]PWC56962.1 CDP-diacylglycerol O-phosphatidyltransferase [Azospirillum sp. TSO22-1]